MKNFFKLIWCFKWWILGCLAVLAMFVCASILIGNELSKGIEYIENNGLHSIAEKVWYGNKRVPRWPKLNRSY